MIGISGQLYNINHLIGSSPCVKLVSSDTHEHLRSKGQNHRTGQNSNCLNMPRERGCVEQSKLFYVIWMHLETQCS